MRAIAEPRCDTEKLLAAMGAVAQVAIEFLMWFISLRRYAQSSGDVVDEHGNGLLVSTATTTPLWLLPQSTGASLS